jgi:hypothetical protein
VIFKARELATGNMHAIKEIKISNLNDIQRKDLLAELSTLRKD